jgi:hypothetical protein
MKKMLVLALALVFMLSGAAMADGHEYTGVFEQTPFNPDLSAQFADGGDYAGYENVDDGGVVFWNDVDPENPGDYTHLESFNREEYYLDMNSEESRRQKVEITLDVEAYIPCFLEMRLTGNQGTTSAISYGPGAEAVGDAEGYLMIFDNEIGGYLDEEWQSLGYGSNVTLNPGDDVFIGACDIFGVEVISNDNYRYDVESDALDGVGGANGETLPMYMRTDLGGGWLANDFVFNAPKTFSRTRNAGQKLTAVHNFKVPFNMNTVHGEYNGEIVFRAVTI